LEDVVKGALGFSRESLGYNAKFAYPREGGISALPRALANGLKVPPSYHTAVTRVDMQRRTATFADGSKLSYRKLVNTMPLPTFVAMLEGASKEIVAAAAKLRATTVHYFDIGVRGPGATASQHHWIYFPEPEFIFYRAGSYSAVHADAAPAGCRSYYVEMSGGAESWLTRPAELRERVLADLRKAKVLSAQDEIIFMELRQIPFAYVIFDHNYENCRKIVMDYLAAQDIFTAGRWGGWGYGGMEDAMLDGLAAARWACGHEV
jgi:UDP-galactopyranose mutase